MQIHFSKYQGTGNDFILIDNRNKMIKKHNVDLVKKLCDRKFGIGADGLMLLENKADYDFEMVYYNSDGNESSMCGNGGRCIVAFAHQLGLIKDKARFWAIDGEHEASIFKDEKKMVVCLKMIDVNEVEIGQDYFYLNTGSPHYVKFIKNINTVDVCGEGKNIRYNERFRAIGTNVNFVEELKNAISARTYERGVEDETLSCGTGVCAAALAWAVKNNLMGEQHCSIQTPGGNLSVKLNRDTVKSFKNIWLEGPATFVFNGEIDLASGTSAND